VQPGMSWAHRRNGGSRVNGAPVPEAPDMAAQLSKRACRKSATSTAWQFFGGNRWHRPRCWRLGDTVRAARVETRSCV
jgi:hypothetical protein